MSGMGVLGREHYGVLSLMDKVENVRDPDVEDSMSPIIQNIMNALGLDFEACYKTAYKLRYGRVMLMMNQVRYVLKVSLASFVGLLLIDVFF
jgi:DNA topoisomerase-2